MELVTTKTEDIKQYTIEIPSKYNDVYIDANKNGLIDFFQDETKISFSIEDLEDIIKSAKEHVDSFNLLKIAQPFSVNDRVKIKETQKIGVVKSVKDNSVLIKIDNEPLFWIILKEVEKV